MATKKELIFYEKETGLSAPQFNSEEAYEKFFRENILPLEIEKSKRKDKEIKNFYRQKNQIIPPYIYNPLDDVLDTEDEELQKMSKRNKELFESVNNINSSLKAIDQKDREMRFIHENSPRLYKIVPTDS